MINTSSSGLSFFLIQIMNSMWDCLKVKVTTFCFDDSFAHSWHSQGFQLPGVPSQKLMSEISCPLNNHQLCCSEVMLAYSN